MGGKIEALCQFNQLNDGGMLAEQSGIRGGVEQDRAHFHKSGSIVRKDLMILSNSSASFFVHVPIK